MDIVTRSTTLSMKFCNVTKCSILQKFVDDYSKVLQNTVDELYEMSLTSKLPAFYNAHSHGSNLTATALQAVGKQACQIVKGERALARKQKRATTKPIIKNIVIDLDERFVSLETGTDGEFDAWLTVRRFESLGMRKSVRVNVPLRLTKHFNKLISRGWLLKKGVKLNLKMNCFVFHFERPVSFRTEGETLGVDIGITDTISDSRGNKTSDIMHPEGWTMKSVLQNLYRKKKGSKGFKRAQSLRDNFIGWSINRLNLADVKELKLENIKHMKRGKKVDRFRNGWSYPKIFDRLKRRAEDQNVSVTLVNPRNTSRTCSVCGVVDENSRRGKSFKCVTCGHAADADLNAAINIKCSPALPAKRGVYSPSCTKIERTDRSMTIM